ncbi:putative amidoligase enzyme-domain-containing protein [Chaetomium strumarium]|uniref:Amidoligase enzyme-domain-containing protein n=1 Tax=Chaetomium strumarium TaxID=1170767 RepID=A0AAJ0M373_9PEZI|nr:putative amidoligase enzyme-domain-containing protein [Chaetomium strumarium]
MSGRTAARTAPSAGLTYQPYFGVEIEIFVKLNKDQEDNIKDKQRRAPSTLPDHLRYWDFSLSNEANANVADLKDMQRARVGMAVEKIIDLTLGPGHGWSCKADASLKEWTICAEAPDRKKWWGIEIISPPTSVTTSWQREIEDVFDAIGKKFDFWTNTCCATHVHVSPGPNKNSKYKLDQLVNRAKGAYFWEDALCEVLPPERRKNRYALPNHQIYAGLEYLDVTIDAWRPLFERLENTASGRDGKVKLLNALRRGPVGTDQCTRYVSTSFHPTDSLGTIELRRQAGSASAMTVIHRVLLAVTLHVSGLRYDYRKVHSRLSYPTVDELIAELQECIKDLPGTCHGKRFVNWLRWCVATYARNYQPSEFEINKNERCLRWGGEYPTVRLPARTRPNGPSLPRTPATQRQRAASRAPARADIRDRAMVEAWEDTRRARR